MSKDSYSNIALRFDVATKKFTMMIVPYSDYSKAKDRYPHKPLAIFALYDRRWKSDEIRYIKVVEQIENTLDEDDLASDISSLIKTCTINYDVGLYIALSI